MAETKDTYTLLYTIKEINLQGLKRLIKEVKSITGLAPDKLIDSTEKEIKL